jgi:hypothetical protein
MTKSLHHHHHDKSLSSLDSLVEKITQELTKLCNFNNNTKVIKKIDFLSIITNLLMFILTKLVIE